MASALSVLLVAVALILMHLYQRQIRHAKQFVTVTGRGYRQGRIALGKWKVPLFVFALTFVTFAVVLPLFMLIWRSLLRFYVYPSANALKFLNLNAYSAMFNDPDAAMVLKNTGIVAFGSGIVITALAAAVGWQVVRGTAGPAWSRSLNMLAFAPQAFPGIVIGLALIYLYLWLPIPIYGTVWILVIAMITKYLAYSTGTMIAAQMQISGELEECSRISGAGGLATYWRIVMPLLAPALGACLLWVVIHVVRELGLALMLYSLQSQVLSTKIWLLWENGRVADACATGVLTVVALLILLAIPTLWGSGRRLVRRLSAVQTARTPLPLPAGGAA
jgi:iron(III) transport system permease protein